MDKRIQIIMDASGHLGELGISQCQKQIFNMIKRLESTEVKVRIKIFSWNQEIKEIKKTDDLKFEGKSNYNILFDFLEKIENDVDTIIFSDCWEINRELKKRGEDIVKFVSESNLNIHFVMLGDKDYPISYKKSFLYELAGNQVVDVVNSFALLREVCSHEMWNGNT